MDSSEKVLKVAEAKAKDAGRGIARVDPAVMDVLGLTAGDVLQIEGKKRTLTAPSEGTRMSASTRRCRSARSR
jgi:hypothetical protein